MYAMKKLCLLICCLCALQLLDAQPLKLGAKVGIGSRTVKAGELFIRNSNDLDSLKLSFSSSKPSIQMGLFARVSLLGIYVQPELLLTFTNATYEEQNVLDASMQTFRKENLVYMDVPVMVGMKFAFLRVQGGPVFSTLLNNKSELRDLDGLERSFKKSALAGQIGVGLDIWKLTFDLRYEFRLSKKKDQFSFLGRGYALSTRKSQALMSVGYVF